MPPRVASCSSRSSAGCATSLSSFQPAHVVPDGHVGAEVGLDVSIPTGAVTRTIDTAKALASSEGMLSDKDKRTVFAAGFNLALSPPSLVQHVGLTYAPGQRWELGLRYAARAWRLGARRQLSARRQSGWDLTIGLGLQRFGFALPIDEVIPIVDLEELRALERRHPAGGRPPR